MLGELIKTIDLFIKKADFSYQEIHKMMPLSNEVLSQENNSQIVDSFIFRFAKIQDLIGDKLFLEFLKCLGEYKKKMVFIDILNQLEKLEILESSHNWRNYKDVRNKITHEYPNNIEDIIDGINKALDIFTDMKHIYSNIKEFLKEKNYEIT